MKSIRLNVFETNSSSSHAIVICEKDIMERLKNKYIFLKRKSFLQRCIYDFDEGVDIQNIKEDDIIKTKELKNYFFELKKEIDNIEDSELKNLDDYIDILEFLESEDNIYDYSILDKKISERFSSDKFDDFSDFLSDLSCDENIKFAIIHEMETIESLELDNGLIVAHCTLSC